MRKGLGLFFAISLLGVGVLAATPAGSATAKGPTCKTFTATVTDTPPLPKISVKTFVTSKVVTTGKIGGCTGGPAAGVTGSTIKASYTYKGNCSTFAGLSKGSVTTPGPSVLTWSNGKTSNTTTTIKTLSKVGVYPLKLQLTTKITKGQYAGTTTVGTVIGTAAQGKTACQASGLAKSFLNGVPGSFTFK
jgi:hypothetical protein